MSSAGKAFHNIWIRNGALFLFLMFIVWLTNDKDPLGPFTGERFKVYFYYAVDFLWIFSHNKILIEKFLLRKKYKFYFLLLLLSYVAYLPFYYYMNGKPSMSIMAILVAMMGLTANKLLGIGIYFIVRYIIDRDRFYKATLTAKDLELELLKGQLNPHFLFNALNNIYSHLLTEMGNGQELILKLSELMRYILDCSKKQYVSITEELIFIENYLAFEKERLSDRCTVIYHSEITHPEMKIAPLILFTFVENAFKHGTLSMDRSVIKMSIQTANDRIRLKVSNPIYASAVNSTKLGLENTRRRLELIYPEKHSLIADTTENEYSVSLEIQYSNDLEMFNSRR